MNRIARRTGIVVAAVLFGAATTLVAPTLATAAVALPAPTIEDFYVLDYGPSADDGAAELDFVAPAPTHDATKVLVGYEAVLYTGVSFATEVQHHSTDNVKQDLFIFENLTYGQAYDVSVRAVYADNGAPAYSEPVYASSSFDSSDGDVFDGTPLRHTPPVTGLTAKSTASGTVTLRWNAPSIPANTQPLGYYSVTAAAVEGGDFFADPEKFKLLYVSVPFVFSTTYVLKGLKNGVDYDISVSTNGGIGGFGGYDDASVSVTPFGAPAKASKLAVRLGAGAKATVKWKAAKNTAAGPVQGYKLYVNGKFVKKIARVVGKGTYSTTAKHIKKGKSYRFTVKTYNSHGSSKALTVTKKWKKS